MVLVEGDQASVEGVVVKAVEGDAFERIQAVLIIPAPWNYPSTSSGQVV
ncbi:MAG: hypothetical protein M3R08_05770 [Bacteroidota bacterium]|nr:hypothetical protein [Bacteroidota bacterium]